MPETAKRLRVTVCELPHEPDALAAAWRDLCEHTARHASDFVLLPELATVAPMWEEEQFDLTTWVTGEVICNAHLARLGDLHAAHVVGTRPVSVGGKRLNLGYLWSAASGVVPLRSKIYLPAEPGSWEARWFDRGDAAFPTFRAGELAFGLNVCTELWALETYAAYAAGDVQIVLSPRATAAATTAKWLAIGVVAAVRSGSYSLSSNRVDPSGACGGVGWIISPDGEVLAQTSAQAPFATMEIDLGASVAARNSYPRYVLAGEER